MIQAPVVDGGSFTPTWDSRFSAIPTVDCMQGGARYPPPAGFRVQGLGFRDPTLNPKLPEFGFGSPFWGLLGSSSPGLPAQVATV